MGGLGKREGVVFLRGGWYPDVHYEQLGNLVELNITLPVVDLWELFFACTKTSIFGIAQILAQEQAIIACALSQKAQCHSHNSQWRWNSK